VKPIDFRLLCARALRVRALPRAGSWRAAAFCLLGVAALAVSCAPAENRPSIVVVVVDTLRADHLGTYGYVAHPTSPHLDQRAPAAAVFERAFSTAPWTLPAFGSLLTGQLPTRHAAGVVSERPARGAGATAARDLVGHAEKWFHQLDEELPTLGTVLQGAGYRTAAIMNNAFLSPEFGLDRGFGSYDYDAINESRLAVTATDLALEWLWQRDQAGDEAPFLLLVHYFDPHMPYAAPEPFLGRFAAPYAADEFDLPIEDMRRLRYPVRDRDEGWQGYKALEQALYGEEIAYTDQELERLLAALDERGFLEDGYLLVTSDHGEEFDEHGWSEHGHSVYNEVIRVPLMMWGPGVTPGRYELPVSLVDVMPTLLDLAGVGTDEEFEGVSLSQALREGPASRAESAIRFDRPLFAEGILYGDEKKSLTRWPWKLFADIDDSAELLFQLELDPGELNGYGLNRMDELGRDRLFTMLAELEAKMIEAGANAGGRGAALSEETLQRLRALGYIR